MKSSLAMVPVLLLLGGCAALGSSKEDPVKLRMDEMDARIGRIDRIVSNQSLMQMASRIDAQQEELRQLRGRLEELQNENAQLRKEQRDLYADLDKRLSTAAAAPPAPAVAPGGADEMSQYNRGLEQLRVRDYAGAVETFRNLSAAFPTGQLADNTQYWLGEAYYVTQDYAQAAAAFQRVLTTWPNARKAPDALLKLGYTQLEQGKQAEGRASLQQVVAKFPGTEPARLAADRLARLPK